MTLRVLQRSLCLAAAVSLATGGASAQSAFPRSSLPPGSYTPRGLAGGPPASVTTQSIPAAGAQTVRIDLGSPAGPSRMMALPKGKSAVIELPVDARDVLVSDPKVADVVLSTPRRIYILGSSAGQTDAVFFDASGRQILNLNIRVDQDVTSLVQTLSRVLENSSIRIEALNDSLILSGEVASAGEADRAVRLAQSAVTKPEQVINMLSIAGPEQVMLKVRIVEVDRTVIKQLGLSNSLGSNNGLQSYSFGQTATYGVTGSLLGGAQACTGQNGSRTTNYNNTNTTNNTSNNSSNNTFSNTSGNTSNLSNNTTSNNNTDFTGSGVASSVTVLDINGNPVTIPGSLNATAGYGASAGNAAAVNSAINNVAGGAASNVLSNVANSVASTVFSRIVGTNFNACLAAFERVGLVRTLAEPNLTAVSGEAGSFLAGGEFPVPVSADNTGKVTIEFKPFGVGLGYTPVVLSGGRISLKLSTEFSELTNVGSFSLSMGNTASVVIPGLSVRRTSTTVELPSGGSMMISGLLQSVTKQTLDALPGLMQLPMLGALFRSRDFVNNETELVVIVTPYLVKAVSPDQLQTPADGLQIASDMQTVLLGRLNAAFGHFPAKTAASSYQGPYGYVVD